MFKLPRDLLRRPVAFNSSFVRLGSLAWAFSSSLFSARHESMFKRHVHQLAQFHWSGNGLSDK